MRGLLSEDSLSNSTHLITYFIASGVAALANLLSRILYSQIMAFSGAVTCAYFTGMIVNFLLSSLFVFSWYKGGKFLNVLFKFTLVASAGLIVTLVASDLARRLLLWLNWFPVDHAELISHAFGIGMAFFASFAGHSLFTYRQTGMFAAIKRFLS